MEAELRMCRVCTTDEGDDELVPIFEKNNKVAMAIFLISQVKVISDVSKFCDEISLILIVKQIMQISSVRSPALICRGCMKDLSKAMKFRRKCIQADDFFRKQIDEEGETSKCHDGVDDESVKVKQEVDSEEQKIKDEPTDDFNLDLFDNIDTILEENLGELGEAGALGKAKKEESVSETSESESDYDDVHGRKRRSKSSKRSSEYRDFDLG